MLFEPALDQGKREFGTVDGDIQLSQQEGHATDVILVAVGEDETANHSRVLLEIREIGSDYVDAEEFRFGKHHAGVNHDDVIAVAESHAVHSELAQPSDGHYLQFSIRHMSIFNEDQQL